MQQQKKQKLTLLDRIGDGFDSIVEVFSPQAGFKRFQFRWARRMFRGYRSAKSSRLTGSLLPGGGSADEDILPDLPTLRKVSRDLCRNDAHAAGIASTVSMNVVGNCIRPQSRVDREILNLSDKTAGIFQKQAERIWKKWLPFADSADKLDFYEMQSLIDRQILENGEAIVLPLMLDKTDSPYSLALDVIESDRLETPFHMRADKSIRSGVKMGDRGQPISYFIRTTHPGDLTVASGKGRKYQEIPAVNPAGRKNILHLFWQSRPGQTRGVPFFPPVMNYFKDLADYMEAELVTARIAACFALFIEHDDPYGAAAGQSNSKDSKGRFIEDMEPGKIYHMGQGEKVHPFNPQRPGGQYDMFVNSILRAISSALGLPYELVAKDFSKVNYSSARASLLEARKYFRLRQDWLSRKFNQPIWEMLLEEAFLRGDLTAPDFFSNKYDYCRARWISPGWGWVDPVKEVTASKLAIQSGLSTLAEEAAAQGRDWEEVLEQRKREQDKMRELGIFEVPVKIVVTQQIKEDSNREEGAETVVEEKRKEEKVGV